MKSDTTHRLDAVLRKATTAFPGVPGVVAAVTDRDNTLFAGAAGVRSTTGHEPMTLDTVLTVFSTTKAVAATAALQLVERGQLDLDAPAAHYAPEIGAVQVFERFGADGEPILRAPRRPITTRMLLLHTAGFGYSNFNPLYMQLEQSGLFASPGEATDASHQAPLLFDPGEAWEYGLGVDWSGRVIEGITGRRLGDVLQSEIFEPLGMLDTAFVLRPDMRDRLAPVHARREDGGLDVIDFVLPQDAQYDMAGHGLYSTAPDYLRFIRAWLADGQGEHGRILSKETIEWASADGLDGIPVHPLPGVNRFMTLDIDLYPGTAKSWAYSFLRLNEKAPTGRSEGSLSWAGLANTYFWIDRAANVGGFWAGNVLPLADPSSLDAYLSFEAAVYASSTPSEHASADELA